MAEKTVFVCELICADGLVSRLPRICINKTSSLIRNYTSNFSSLAFNSFPFFFSIQSKLFYSSFSSAFSFFSSVWSCMTKLFALLLSLLSLFGPQVLVLELLTLALLVLFSSIQRFESDLRVSSPVVLQASFSPLKYLLTT
jgi:hypothetical protein